MPHHNAVSMTQTQCGELASVIVRPRQNWLAQARRQLTICAFAVGLGVIQTACTSSNGAPQTFTIGITITSPMAAGESFRFSLQDAQHLTVTESGVAVAFAQPLALGAAYTINEIEGPRTCTLSPNRTGTVVANVEATADCGALPGSSGLTGKLYAPANAKVVLENNGADDLTVVEPPFNGQTSGYNFQEFTFATQLTDGVPYQVSVKNVTLGQVCAVYKGANGTMPAAADALRVGCELIDDLVSRSTDDSKFGTYFESTAPVVGGSRDAVASTADGYGEGRFVAFVSAAAGLGAASGTHRQVFWRDHMTGETLLVSAAVGGVEGDNDSYAPAISADGLAVAFESHSTNLVSGDTNGLRDVFIWSALAQSDGVKRVSLGPDNLEANGESFEPTLSGDGLRVAFSTNASNLTTGVAGTSTVNVVLRELASGNNTLVSVDAGGVGVGGSKPALSEDGSVLTFYSFSDKLALGDSNGLWDIFVYDVPKASIRRVSLTDTGAERNQGSDSASRVVAPAISGDGRWVAFATTATNMVSGDTNGAQDVFVVDLETGAVRIASQDSANQIGDADSPVGQGERPSLSYDGKWIAFTTQASNLGATANNVLMRNLTTGEVRVVSEQSGSSVGPASISRTGAYVVFGAGNALDGRFNSTGLFSHFTGVERAWWWLD